MRVNDINTIEELRYFDDKEILKAVKFVCFEDESKPNFLIYKIKIGKLVLTAGVASVDGILINDHATKQKIGNKAVEAVLQILRNNLNVTIQ